jgi:hypothetical protein
MSSYPRKIDRAAAERLLRGEPADPRHPDDLLAVLLATVAAPAHLGEPAGEEAAVAAFRAARAAVSFRAAGHSAGAAATTRQRRWESAWTRRWTRHPVRLAVVALTAATAGGVALTAGTVPWSPNPDGRRPATSPAGSPQTGVVPGASRGQDGSPAGTPRPSYVGLCRAYNAGVGSAPGKALDNPAFSSLIRSAGGRDKVAAYCAALLAAEARGAKKPNKNANKKQNGSSGAPGHSGRSHESGRASEHPSVQPTSSHVPPGHSGRDASKTLQTSP